MRLFGKKPKTRFSKHQKVLCVLPGIGVVTVKRITTDLDGKTLYFCRDHRESPKEQWFDEYMLTELPEEK